ncbi:MAG: DUF3089 domain-containing protein [Bacteroidota bacterium]
MKILIFLLIASYGLLISCSNKYRIYKDSYTLKSKSGVPDYSDLSYWAAHPWKHDPSDSIPMPLRNEKRDSIADVFFLHPTSYTKKIKMRTPNAAIDNSLINAKTDYTSILYQASVFNQQSRVFAPRYRQADYKLFFAKDKAKADAAFAIAYQDIKYAFEYYLQHWNNGRPIIIASHSQGSKMAEQLLKEFFEDRPLQKQLVVAYIVGWPVPKDYFTSLTMCADSMQTGCICSWRTLRNGFVPYYLKNENGNSFVTNPLTWKTDDAYASKQLNKGSVLRNFNKIYKRTTDAQISNGLLYVKKPKFPWSFLYFSRNYHIGDINLFYINIRENVALRIHEFLTH